MDGKRIGDYLIYERLGTDANGDVWLGRHAITGADGEWVAVKVLRVDRRNDPKRNDRFVREIQALAKSFTMRNWDGHVVRISHAGFHVAQDTERPYLAIEYIPGITLEQLVQRAPGHRLTPAIACEVVRQATLGAAFLHSLRWVHRDLKPRNIMITSEGVVKVIDFGSVLIASDSAITTDESLCGAPAYIAPEQIDNAHDVDGRADVYSLAHVLYYLLTGTQAFNPQNIMSKKDLQEYRSKNLPQLEQTLSHCPSEIVALLQKAFVAAAALRPWAMDFANSLVECASTGVDLREWVLPLAINRTDYPSKPLPEDSDPETDLPSTLVSGFLHMHSTGFHNVQKEFSKNIIPHSVNVIATKYLFAHSQSFELYRKVLDQPAYTIHMTGEALFGNNCERIADEISGYFLDKCGGDGRRPIAVVSLGIGQGKKEKWLIRGLLDRGLRPTLYVIDINPTFIQSSFEELQGLMRECSCRFILGDFDYIEHYGEALDKCPVIFLALGGTFGNQREQVLLSHLRRLTRQPALLLMDFETDASLRGKSIAGYDTDANKRFIQRSIKALVDEDVEMAKISAIRASEDARLKDVRLSDVDSAETLVMLVEMRAGGLVIAGYSSRYRVRALRQFLKSKGLDVEFYVRREHTYLALCSILSS